jgi:hypothetical protein
LNAAIKTHLRKLTQMKPILFLSKRLLALAALAILFGGCETDIEMQRATSVSPDYPPAPPNAFNTPALRASGVVFPLQ